MGCVGPKSIIEVREGMTFLDLSVRQIEVSRHTSLPSSNTRADGLFEWDLQHLNSAHNVNVPFILMNSFNTDEDTARIIQKYSNHRIELMTFNQVSSPVPCFAVPSRWLVHFVMILVSLPSSQQGDPPSHSSISARRQVLLVPSRSRRLVRCDHELWFGRQTSLARKRIPLRFQRRQLGCCRRPKHFGTHAQVWCRGTLELSLFSISCCQKASW